MDVVNNRWFHGGKQLCPIASLLSICQSERPRRVRLAHTLTTRPADLTALPGRPIYRLACLLLRTTTQQLTFHSWSRLFVLQEWNHIGVCLLLGAAALGFPLYDLHDVGDGPFAEL